MEIDLEKLYWSSEKDRCECDFDEFAKNLRYANSLLLCLFLWEENQSIIKKADKSKSLRLEMARMLGLLRSILAIMEGENNEQGF